MIHTIYPYISEWNGTPVWVFDDPVTGLINEGLVSGTDKMLDRFADAYDLQGERWLELTFSDEPFPGYMTHCTWLRAGLGEGLAEGHMGNWYLDRLTYIKGWLCPALFKYFPAAPKNIYIRFVPAPLDKQKKVEGTFVVQ